MTDEFLGLLFKRLATKVLKNDRRKLNQIVEAIEAYARDESIVLTDDQKRMIELAKEMFSDDH